MTKTQQPIIIYYPPQQQPMDATGTLLLVAAVFCFAMSIVTSGR